MINGFSSMLRTKQETSHFVYRSPFTASQNRKVIKHRRIHLLIIPRFGRIIQKALKPFILMLIPHNNFPTSVLRFHKRIIGVRSLGVVGHFCMTVSLLPVGTIETALFECGHRSHEILALELLAHDLLFFLFLVRVDFDVALD